MPSIKAKTFVVTISFSVPPDYAAPLRDPATIRAEAQSWLESLGAVVHAVTVKPSGGDWHTGIQRK